ncbi:type I-G CRISPR-associated RAMP protein Csb1/Cas7g [Chloracidobacterium thermophilum]|uniref:CRISPR-associated protein GSU0053 (Cas_GSU0053) n=1 Tax=Chloracidobacterium thermophilum (strain B) TaxID=981222 RepID=G2LLL2_CHLTF|nr:type I-U CRISPR-associated RAMP protein Csb1/Cas7u [Chloracidobacterium thermophilum]AEP13808.1 CRISPR-associated protein GSU0053 (Cas_GSU0053) [Chloracidobacterium thermophilum B]QUV80259.1 type I-U CRISPR-associated protein Cas7 [Chloracidobacterium thermophilum]
MSLSLQQLQQAVRTATALRCRLRLQPAGGPGTKVFPPTYEGGRYALEERRMPGYDHPVRCVLMDSVQSQANRMEEALQQAVDDGRLALPLVEVDFTPYFPGNGQPEDMRLLEPIGRVSSLQAPHRIVDAILRDSVVIQEQRKPFRSSNVKQESSYGRQLREAAAHHATPLFELCPTALLFGMWDSTGPKGGLGAKFERAMVSEIVGINAVLGAKTSSRIDPLGIQLKAGPLYRTPPTEPLGWTLDPGKAVKDNKGKPVLLGDTGRPSEANHGNVTRPSTSGSSRAGTGRPSEANHGNVTPTISERDRQGEFLGGGVTIDYAEQSIVLSLPALRRLRFPINGRNNRAADEAAWTVLAALGLCAAILADDAGLDLRSRCLLWPQEPLKWELLGRPGEIQSDIVLDAEAALRLFMEAVDEARKCGLPWRTTPLQLQPAPELVKLVVKSQQLAQSQGTQEE